MRGYVKTHYVEPETVTGEEGENPELIDFRRRFWIGLVLTVPVLLLEMGGHLIGLDRLISGATSNWLQLLLGTPVVLWAGWPFFQRGWHSLRSRSLNMFTLISMGTGVALVYSISLCPVIWAPIQPPCTPCYAPKVKWNNWCGAAAASRAAAAPVLAPK